MSTTANVVPPDLVEFYGDFNWPARSDHFSAPYCKEVVTDLPLVLAQLRNLYPPDVCRQLVHSDNSHMVVGLFLGDGWCDHVDELLQLGADLARCDGWRDRPKLIGELRSRRGFDGVRMEVGIEAGLRRVHVVPAIEPGAKDERRPDLVMPVASLAVGLELKGLGDPAFELNVGAIEREVMWLPGLGPHKGRGMVHVMLSEEALDSCQAGHDEFLEASLPQIVAEVQAALPQLRPNGTVHLPTAGTLYRSLPSMFDPENTGLGVDVPAQNPAGPFPRLRHALRLARKASSKFEKTAVDVRAVVIWGSLDHLPGEVAAREAQKIVDHERDTWASIGLDWIVFLNCHGRKGGRTTEIALCRLPQAKHEIPAIVLKGMTSWGLQHPRGRTWDDVGRDRP